jgi:hypothetical protein
MDVKRLLSAILDWRRRMADLRVTVPSKKDLEGAIRAHDEDPNAHGGPTGGGGDVTEEELVSAAAQARAAAIAAAAADASTKDTAVANAAAADAQAKADQAENEP